MSEQEWSEQDWKASLRSWVDGNTAMTGAQADGMVELLYDALVLAANPGMVPACGCCATGIEAMRKKHGLNEAEAAAVMRMAEGVGSWPR